MKKHKSPLINKEYWVDATRTTTFEGLPCFSAAEIKSLSEQIKTNGITKEQFEKIYNLKLEFSPEAPIEFEKEQPTWSPSKTDTIYNNAKRGREAKTWTSRIKETILNSEVKTFAKREKPINTVPSEGIQTEVTGEIPEPKDIA